MTSSSDAPTGLRYLALAEWLLISPAVLFFAALFVRNLQPPPYEPAQTARQVVEWFSARPRLALNVFLMAMPFAAFLLGCMVALRRWSGEAGFRQAAGETLAVVRAHLTTLLIAAATLTAGGVLAFVALHVITD